MSVNEVKRYYLSFFRRKTVIIKYETSRVWRYLTVFVSKSCTWCGQSLNRGMRFWGCKANPLLSMKPSTLKVQPLTFLPKVKPGLACIGILCACVLFQLFICTWALTVTRLHSRCVISYTKDKHSQIIT